MIKQNSNNRGIVSILDKNIKAPLCLHMKETHRASVSILSGLKLHQLRASIFWVSNILPLENSSGNSNSIISVT